MTHKRARLGGVCEIKGGKRLPAGHSFADTPTAHPYIRGRDIKGGRITIDAPVYVTDDTALQISRYTVTTGDALLTIVGNIGDVAIVPDWLDGANLTENAARLRAKAGFDQHYLGLALQAPDARQQMERSAAGAAQAKLGLYKIAEIEVWAPPLPTQRRIAGILSAYDDLIENNTKRIKILEEMARALYREWFVHFRFPGHEKVRLVDSPLGQIPEAWEASPLKPLVLRIKNKPVYKEADVGVAGDVIVVDQSRSELLGFHDGAATHQASPKDPMVLFGDHTCKMQLMVQRFSTGPNVVTFRAKVIRPLTWLFFTVQDLVETKEYKRHWSELMGKSVAIPTAALCDDFAAAVTPFLELTEVLKAQSRTLFDTRDLLLPRLISGEIDVDNLDLPEVA